MLALIDGDIVLHRVGYTTENEEFGIAKWRVDEMLDGIIDNVAADKYRIFLSDSHENNFRYQVFPDYKGNRTAPKPRHLEALKEYVILNWNAEFCHGMEADDGMGIAQCSSHQGEEDSCICSIDKDLNQIPGLHFNFVKGNLFAVSMEEAVRFFYGQMLIGDASDNILGCPGIGPVKAAKLLEGLIDEVTLCNVVVGTYVQRCPHLTRKQLLETVLTAGRVLRIKQEEFEPLWHFPDVSLMEEYQSLSTQPEEKENDQSTGPIMGESGDGSCVSGPETGIGHE